MDFRLFYKELMDLLLEDDVDAILQCAYRFTQAPVLFVDLNYQMLGMCPKHPIGAAYWDVMVEKGHAPSDYVLRYQQEGYITATFNSREPVLLDWGSIEQPVVACGVIVNEALIGSISFACYDKAQYPLLAEALKIVVQALRIHYNNRHLTSSNPELGNQSFLHLLFHDEINSPEQLAQWQAHLGVDLRPSFVLASSITTESISMPLLQYVRQLLSGSMPNTLFYDDTKVLYLLFYGLTDEKHSKLVTDKLTALAEAYQIKFAISACFNSLLETSKYYYQMKRTMQIGSALYPQQNIYYYGDMLSDIMLFEQIKNHDVDIFAPDPAYKLQLYDQEYNTEYLKTLSCYILSMRNFKATFQELDIHRNTLQYRLNKIEELTNIDLNDARECNQLYIFFSMAKIKEKFS